MIDGQRILVVYPAAAAVQGHPTESLQPFLGVPLVALVGHLVAEIPATSQPIRRIPDVARESRLDALLTAGRSCPANWISDLEVLSHALLEIEHLDGVTYDIVVMLQPTSPLRRTAHVRDTIQKLIERQLGRIWTVSETDSKNHPLKQLTVSDDRLDFYDQSGKQIIARQRLVPVYHRNGVAYAIRRSCLLDQQSIKGERTVFL